MNYPVTYTVPFVEERDRVSTFFRILLAIPVFFVGFVYGIGAFFAAVAAWFSLVFTGKYPEGLYAYNAGVVRYYGRMQAYVTMQTDAYPPFDMGEHPEYPAQITVGPAKAEYDRMKVLFRPIVGIPVMVGSWLYNMLTNAIALISWFLIVFTGKQNDGLQNIGTLGVTYATRTTAYFLLLTEDWPPFAPEASAPNLTPAA